MKRQIATRVILPADHDIYQVEAIAFFNDFIAQLADLVRNAAIGETIFSTQIDIQDLVRLQHFAITRDPAFLPASSVQITEIEETEQTTRNNSEFATAEFMHEVNPEDPGFISNNELDTLTHVATAPKNMIGNTSSAILTPHEENTTVCTAVPTYAVADTSMVVAPMTLSSENAATLNMADTSTAQSPPTLNMTDTSDLLTLNTSTDNLMAVPGGVEAGSSSEVPFPVATTSRPRGRPRKNAATPKVQNQVPRSTRQFNDGCLYELPNQPSRRRASSVPRATPPAVLQVSEMQHLGIEECLIDPTELTEERLLQGRDEE
jgi:hypothetical protein